LADEIPIAAAGDSASVDGAGPDVRTCGGATYRSLDIHPIVFNLDLAKPLVVIALALTF